MAGCPCTPSRVNTNFLRYGTKVHNIVDRDDSAWKFLRLPLASIPGVGNQFAPMTDFMAFLLITKALTEPGSNKIGGWSAVETGNSRSASGPCYRNDFAGHKKARWLRTKIGVRRFALPAAACDSVDINEHKSDTVGIAATGTYHRRESLSGNGGAGAPSPLRIDTGNVLEVEDVMSEASDGGFETLDFR